jgi:hypothetical protein
MATAPTATSCGSGGPRSTGTPPSPPIWQKTAIEKARKQGVESLTEDEVNRLQSLGVEFIILEDESRVYLRKS